MANYEIDIQEVNVIDGGVEVFASATKDGLPVGFGKDGTVEIERFRIINPPILVEDANGDIEEVYTDPISNETRSTFFREDPEAALQESIAQTIILVGKEGSSIITGKRGNTVTTIYGYADAQLRSESTDNYTWSQTRDLTTASHSVTVSASTTAGPYLEWAPAHASSKVRLIRYFTNFDTSAIGSDTIDSAIYSVYVNATPWDTMNDADSYATVIQNSSASDTTFTTADFDAIYNADDTEPLVGTKNMKELCDSGQRRDFTTATLGFHDYTLNSTGEGVINGSGYTKLGLAIGKDVTDTPPPDVDYQIEGLQYRGVGYAGDTSDPKLVITHTAAAAAADNALAFCNF